MDSPEDIAQEVLLVLHERYPALDRAEDLVPLAIEIARFKILAARRKTVRRGENTQISFLSQGYEGSPDVYHFLAHLAVADVHPSCS